MNILVLTNVYPYEKDINNDTTKVVAYFVRKWFEHGHNVLVIINSTAFPHIYYVAGKYIKKFVLKRNDRMSQLPSELWAKEFEFSDKGINVVNLPIKKYKPHGAFGDKAVNRQLHRIISLLKQRDFVPDIITGHWLNPQLMLVAGLSDYYKAKSAFVFHSDYIKERYEKFEVQKYLEQIDRVGFRSKAALEAASEYMRFKNPPFVCVSGIPDDYIQRFAHERFFFRNTNFHILCVGRLVVYKNIIPTISAIASAYNGLDYRFEIIGEGPLQNEIENYICNNNLKKFVRLLNTMPRELVQEKMRNSDIFVLISSNEVFGMVYLEAMLQGCIVIAAQYSGADGIIINGENGFLCEAGSTEELKEILIKIQNMSKEERKRISGLAIDTARKYTESITAKQYLDIISGATDL